jgi:arylsulfatase A-like enzyme
MGHHNLTSGKAAAYDTDVRVPLVMVGPGLPQGRHVKALAANIDLAPTFREMAGLEPSPTADGRSLLGLAEGRPVPGGWRTAVLLEHSSSGRFPGYQALRTRTVTYVRYENGEREYFDRSADPWELRNGVGRLPESELSRLDAALDRYARCRGADDCDAAAQAVASPSWRPSAHERWHGRISSRWSRLQPSSSVYSWPQGAGGRSYLRELSSVT